MSSKNSPRILVIARRCKIHLAVGSRIVAVSHWALIFAYSMLEYVLVCIIDVACFMLYELGL